MGLYHSGGLVEVACNLLDYKVASPEQTLALIRNLAAAEGAQVRISCAALAKLRVVKAQIF
eukprot:scaffold274103_cov33-Prasinocladus_malaysianus.AAC.1